MYVLRLNDEIAGGDVRLPLQPAVLLLSARLRRPQYQQPQRRPGADGAHDPRGDRRRRRRRSTCSGAPSRTSRSGRATPGRCAASTCFPPHLGGRIHRRAVEARRQLGRAGPPRADPWRTPCQRSMAPRWRWHVKAALASTIARVARPRARRGAGARAPSGRSSSAITAWSRTSRGGRAPRCRACSPAARCSSGISTASAGTSGSSASTRSASTSPSGEPLRRAGRRGHVRRWLPRRLRARVPGAQAQGHSGGGLRRDRPGRAAVLAGARQAVPPGRRKRSRRGTTRAASCSDLIAALGLPGDADHARERARARPAARRVGAAARAVAWPTSARRWTASKRASATASTTFRRRSTGPSSTEMRRAGITIGSHTKSHVSLPTESPRRRRRRARRVEAGARAASRRAGRALRLSGRPVHAGGRRRRRARRLRVRVYGLPAWRSAAPAR